jgi:hypothetical protein
MYNKIYDEDAGNERQLEIYHGEGNNILLVHASYNTTFRAFYSVDSYVSWVMGHSDGPDLQFESEIRFMYWLRVKKPLTNYISQVVERRLKEIGWEVNPNNGEYVDAFVDEAVKHNNEINLT